MLLLLLWRDKLFVCATVVASNFASTQKSPDMPLLVGHAPIDKTELQLSPALLTFPDNSANRASAVRAEFSL